MKMKLFIITFFLSASAWSCTSLKYKEKFIASSAVPFAKLLDHSMNIMHVNMSTVKINNQNNEKIFLESMIPHHQGAVDMANSIIVHSTDEVIRNYAISIINSQASEIEYMKSLLLKYK